MWLYGPNLKICGYLELSEICKGGTYLTCNKSFRICNCVDQINLHHAIKGMLFNYNLTFQFSILCNFFKMQYGFLSGNHKGHKATPNLIRGTKNDRFKWFDNNQINNFIQIKRNRAVSQPVVGQRELLSTVRLINFSSHYFSYLRIQTTTTMTAALISFSFDLVRGSLIVLRYLSDCWN